ncbi:MAG: TIGR03546 family protein [Thermodesulfobacteriota bacterium]
MRFFVRFLKVLNSETAPSQISLAACFAMVAGLTPISSPHNLLVLLLALVLTVNLSTFILCLVLFSGFSYLLDPVFHAAGLAILTAGSLEGLWTSLYNITFFRLIGFNNSVLMGSLVFSLALFVPLFFVLNVLIRNYREHVLEWVQKTKFMQALKASKFYRLYTSYSEMGGGGVGL